MLGAARTLSERASALPQRAYTRPSRGGGETEALRGALNRGPSQEDPTPFTRGCGGGFRLPVATARVWFWEGRKG